MGKKLDLSRETYAAFVDSHANTAIHDFMNGALDVAKNAILSTTGQAISWDENGLRLRKWNSDRTGYEDEQIWMKDNLIVFTEDAWESAKMAIGHIHDDELGDLWGVIADSIVGKLLAGENLIIMGTDAAGKKTLFRVDGRGMYAYNSRFWMESANGGAFAIDPSFGLGLGQGNPFKVGPDGAIVPTCIDATTGKLNLDDNGFPVGMNFWAGMDGQVYVRGNITASNFLFDDGTGDVKTLLSEAQKKIPSDYLELFGITVLDPTNPTGTPILKIGEGGIEIYKGDIDWGALDATTQGKINAAQNPGYIQSTHIDATKVESFYIKGNKIEAVIPKTTGDEDTGFILTGTVGGALKYQYLRIYADDEYTVFSSPAKTTAYWMFPTTLFTGNISFNGANVSGLHLTLA